MRLAFLKVHKWYFWTSKISGNVPDWNTILKAPTISPYFFSSPIGHSSIKRQKIQNSFWDLFSEIIEHGRLSATEERPKTFVEKCQAAASFWQKSAINLPCLGQCVHYCRVYHLSSHRATIVMILVEKKNSASTLLERKSGVVQVTIFGCFLSTLGKVVNWM